MSGRVLFHVQHLLGIGHLRRASTIVRALRKAGFEVTVLLGGEVVDGIDFGAAATIQLPSVRALDATFKTLVDEHGAPIDDAFRERRRGLVIRAFDALRPDLVLVESFPFGRRAFRFELAPLLRAASVAGAAVAVSLRDILVAKRDPARVDAIVATVRGGIDLVLVHGDPRLVTLDASFPAAARIADKLRYTGYVYEPMPDDGSCVGAGEVLVSAGGGAVGASLLATALAARPLTSLANAPWRLLAGPNLPMPDYAALASRLPEGVVLERFRADFPALLRRCAVSVSQAGYNTTLDVLASGARAVLVPFATAAETEQTLRAERLAAVDWVRLVREDSLTAAGLAAAIDAAHRGAAARLAVALDGAWRTAAMVASLLAGRDRQ
jgi:predicted glycosyltransferase